MTFNTLDVWFSATSLAHFGDIMDAKHEREGLKVARQVVANCATLGIGVGPALLADIADHYNRERT